MGTYDGLALPAFGEYYRFSADGSTEILFVEDDGVTNITVATTDGGDNAVALTLTDGSTITSGYVQGYYVSQTTSGKYTTGSSQINSIAVDLFLGGEVGCEAEGMYIYVAKSGTPEFGSANISGLVVYMANLGTDAPSSRSAIQLHMEGTTVAQGQDAFVLMRLEGAGPRVTNMFEKSGTSTNPTNFLKTNATDGMVQAITAGGTQDKVLVVNLAGSTYWIPMYAASA